jgi:predicted MFS family arabinose efflux permease
MASAKPQSGITRDIYDLLTGDEDARVCRDIADSACREQPRNFLIHILSLVASKTGDRLASPKLVLSWLMTNLGAPAYMLGLLVPVRESLSLLPQLFVAGLYPFCRRPQVVLGYRQPGAGIHCRRHGARRRHAARCYGRWMHSGLLLVIFSLGRGVCSVAAKDVLGKTVSKNRRGTATGYASSVAGAITILVGAITFAMPPDEQGARFFGILLTTAGALWVLAAIVFSRLVEYSGATEGGSNAITEAVRQFGLIRRDAELRRFLLVRTLLLSTALVAPFYVILASQETGSGLAQLGGLLIATGAASFLSAPLWGRLADRSSRRTMALAALLAAVAGFATAFLAWAPDLPYRSTLFAATYFLLSVAHSGVRLGRKTHLIDMATADNRAAYVAVSNTFIGIMLLAGGVFGAVASAFGPAVAIVALAMLSLFAAIASRSLRDVQ